MTCVCLLLLASGDSPAQQSAEVRATEPATKRTTQSKHADFDIDDLPRLPEFSFNRLANEQVTANARAIRGTVRRFLDLRGRARPAPSDFLVAGFRCWALYASGGAQHVERVGGDPLIHPARAASAPINQRDRAEPCAHLHALGDLVEAALGCPSAAWQLFALEQVERVGASRIADQPHFRRRDQAAQKVIVPIARILWSYPMRRNHRAIGFAFEQAPAEKNLRRLKRRLARRIVARTLCIDCETKHREQRFVEGRNVRGRFAIAIPSAVRPLPMYQAFGQPIAAIVGEAEAFDGQERVALLGGASAIASLDHGNALGAAAFGNRALRLELVVKFVAQ